MNPLIEAARDGMTQGWLMGGMTVAFFSFFSGWVLWAWAPSNAKTMEAAAAMPLDDGPPARGDA
jgi:cbb3-type cytochrome oxidase subunit 3